MARFNRDKFFSAFTKGFGATSSTQKSGLNFLLDKIESDPAWKPTDLRLVAYFLATIKHETGHTFQPVVEKRARLGTKLRATQDRYWLSGYYGRGYVQITWKQNYQKFDIADAPEKALQPETAYRIASQGMLHGLFTGARLTAYADDFVGARKVVNGTDKAELIAGYARKIQACLSLSVESEEVKSSIKQEVLTPEPKSEETPSQSSLADKVKSAATAYSGADESIKALVGRIIQAIWTCIIGLVATLQHNPTKTTIVVLVLILGFIVLHQYNKRQDVKTIEKIKAGKS